MGSTFAELLDHFMGRREYSAGQLSALAHIPKRTIANWREGRVSRPRAWRDLVRVAAALRLSEREANELLEAATQPPIAELRALATNPGDRDLFGSWPEVVNAPFQAPPNLPYFVGRSALLEEIKHVLLNGRYIALCSLNGMGGVGKTVLAAQLAYALRLDFPDGVLWARVDTSNTLSILAAFAAAYGEDVSLHPTVPSRAAAVRAILAGKQALIVLDNAERSEQVRPLLPPTLGKTAVLITTRYDLAVADEMQRFRLAPFAAEGREALDLFACFIGEATVAARREPLQQIATLLGHLPLALAIAAGQIEAGKVAIDEYLARLRAADQRLDALVREDRSVRLSFDLSYQALSQDVRAFFAALGAFGGDDFSARAAAYVADVPEDATPHLLGALVTRSLLRPTGPARYGLHPLLRSYALEKETTSHPRRRMVRFFIEYAEQNHASSAALYPEMQNIVSALDTARELEMLELFMAGVLSLYHVWYLQGDSDRGLPYMQAAREYAQQSGEQSKEARLLAAIGRGHWSLGQSDKARGVFEQGLALARGLDDADLLSAFLLNLGVSAAYNESNYEQAAQYILEALDYARRLDDTERLAQVLSNLANVYYELGEWEQARQTMEEGRSLIEERGEQEGAGYVHLVHNLGVIYLHQGEFKLAEASLQRALAVARALHFRELVTSALATLGDTARRQGQLRRAKRLLAEALELARKHQLPESLTLTLCNLAALAMDRGEWAAARSSLVEAEQISQQAQIAWLRLEVTIAQGELALAQKEPAQARSKFEEVIALAQQAATPEPLAAACYGLARAILPLEGIEAALSHAHRALTLFQRMDHLTARDVQAWVNEHAPPAF